jgi:diadenosine tetraphosphate (Ap4A) HIT family hydrolase
MASPPPPVDCIFCAIVAGRAPASVVLRAPGVTAFMDLNPVNPGHVLVVPNDHAARLGELPAAAGGPLWAAAQQVAVALLGGAAAGVRCEGVNLFLADGAAAGQDVFHVHLHVLPRFAGDGFGLKHPPGYPRKAARAELDAVAAGLRAALGG